LKGTDIKASGWEDADLHVSVIFIHQTSPLIFVFLQWDTYAYKDKKREAKRIEDLAAKRTAQATEDRQLQRKQRQQKKKLNEAWSDKTIQKEERDKRKEKKDRKKKWLREQSKKEEAKEREEDADADEVEVDWKELKREKRTAKRVKIGEI